MPGLVETHLAGLGGRDCRKGAGATLEIARGLLARGVTTFVPTLYSVPRRKLSEAIAGVKEAISSSGTTAYMPGFHMEGPFFYGPLSGLAVDDDLAVPDADTVRALLDECEGLLKIITLSPEIDGAAGLIRLMSDAGLVVRTSPIYPVCFTGGCGRRRRSRPRLRE